VGFSGSSLKSIFLLRARNCLRGQKRSLSRSYETAGTKTDRVDWLIDCHFLPGANGFDHGFGRLSFAEALGNVFAVEETGDVGE